MEIIMSRLVMDTNIKLITEGANFVQQYTLQKGLNKYK